MIDVPLMPLDPDDYFEDGSLRPRRRDADRPVAQCDEYEIAENDPPD